MDQDLCPYSLYSLQFYLLIPLIRFTHNLDLVIPLNYVIAAIIPIVILNGFIKFVCGTDNVTFVKHSPAPDHPHSKSVTLGVIVRSILLGSIFTLGCSFICDPLNSHLVPLGLYLILLSTFHFGEYFVTSLTNPSSLNNSSFLLEQSVAYAVAISSSFIEYFVELYFFPSSKRLSLISLLGLLMAITGEIIRKLAMFTAGKNFTHLIAIERAPNHRLVTNGIYSYFRHPSYAGWFYWAVGTQLLMLNPICFLLFIILSYKFFKDRITYEEALLIRFFGDQYRTYRGKVRLWMPIW